MDARKKRHEKRPNIAPENECLGLPAVLRSRYSSLSSFPHSYSYDVPVQWNILEIFQRYQTPIRDGSMMLAEVKNIIL